MPWRDEVGRRDRQNSDLQRHNGGLHMYTIYMYTIYIYIYICFKHIIIYYHTLIWTSDWNWGLYKINLGLCWGSRFWLWGSPSLVIPRCCHGCLAWYFILWRWAGGEIANPHENISIILISFPHDPMMDPNPLCRIAGWQWSRRASSTVAPSFCNWPDFWLNILRVST